MRPTLRVLMVAALAAFYVLAATEHADRVNTSKARGDQSGYMWDGQNVYWNWHGRQPPVVIGERNRMPLYAGFLALFWTPDISNDVFFERAKRWNIYLSVVLILLLVPVFRRYLPAQATINLTLIVGFGYFIFKAGYVQSELLFYFLFFITFVLCLDLFDRRRGRTALWGRAVAAGAAAAAAHLTKAAMLPFVAIFFVVYVTCAAMDRADRRGQVNRLVAAALVIAAFLAVLSPYLVTNKRVFGHYFYNVNTTFYMWYDDWPQASVGTIKHGDGIGWPQMPADQLPGARKYWREHTLQQIVARVAGGLWDAVWRSYQTFGYLKPLILYLAIAVALLLRQRHAVRDDIRRNRAVLLFLALYGLAYIFGIAFYAPVSGTGTTRFLIAHLLPLFFVLSLLFTREPYATTEWTVAGLRVSMAQIHLAITLLLVLDVAFGVWPRLMTTYGGF